MEQSADMTADEKAIEEAAIKFAKENRTRLARIIANTNEFPSEASPLTVFMAGSPGAGKTEISKAMVDVLEQGTANVEAKKILRLDPDDFRCLIPDSWLLGSKFISVSTGGDEDSGKGFRSGF